MLHFSAHECYHLLMKRILVLFLFIAIVVGSIYAWMVLRPRPSNLLKTSLRHLIHSTVLPVQGSLQWESADETQQNFKFTGWTSYAGTVDLRDLSLIRGNGMMGYSSSPNASDFETANIVLTQDRIAFQEKQFKTERSEWIRSFVVTSTPTDAWFTINRQTFLKELGYPKAIAKGKGEDLRKILDQMEIQKWLVIISSSEQLYVGREYMSIRVRVKEDEFFSGLLSLISAWNAEKPSSQDIVWAKSIARNVAHGEWELMIDEGAGDIVSLTGKWQNVDSQETILGRATLSLVFGYGLSGKIPTATISKDAIDITSALYTKKKGELPSSGERKLPSVKQESEYSDVSSSTMQ